MKESTLIHFKLDFLSVTRRFTFFIINFGGRVTEWLECWTCNQVPPGPPAGFVLGSPKFKSTLVNSQLARLLPVGILKHNHCVLFE